MYREMLPFHETMKLHITFIPRSNTFGRSTARTRDSWLLRESFCLLAFSMEYRNSKEYGTGQIVEGVCWSPNGGTLI